jgi:Ribonuclease G/E
MTRKRTRESLGQLLSSPCPHCQGSGRVRSLESIASDALRRAQHEAALHPTASSIVLRVHPDVAAFLNGHRAQTVGALEALIDRPITVEGFPDLGRGEVEVSGEVPAVDEA